jgi:hypothetical protein
MERCLRLKEMKTWSVGLLWGRWRLVWEEERVVAARFRF